MKTTLFLSLALSLFLNQGRAEVAAPPASADCVAQIQADARAASAGLVTPAQSRRMCQRIAQAEQLPPVPVDSVPGTAMVRTALVCGHALNPLVGGQVCYDWRKREWYGLGRVALGIGGVSLGAGMMFVDHRLGAPLDGEYHCLEGGLGFIVGGNALGCRAYGSGQLMSYFGAGLTTDLSLRFAPILMLRKF